MKYLVVLVLVLGFACGSEEEMSLQDLLPLVQEDGFSSFGKVLPIILNNRNAKAFIENIIPGEYISNGKSIMKSLVDNEGPMATMRKIDKVISIKAVVDGIVTGIASFIMPFVELANMIMAIVGLVILIIYLIEGGDIKSLLGISRSLNSWSFADFNNTGEGRSLDTWSSLDFNIIDNPIVENISEMFFQAMNKYDQMA